jgi:hypothetical protein
VVEAVDAGPSPVEVVDSEEVTVVAEEGPTLMEADIETVDVGEVEPVEVVDEAPPVEVVEVVESVEPDVVEVEMFEPEPVEEEEQFIEPIIEGIDMQPDDEEEPVMIEPVIITPEVQEPELVTADVDVDVDIDGDGDGFEDALQVVEEEFRQGITIGAMDLFKKWENLHRRQRIITLKQIPHEVFSLMSFEQ